MGGKDWPDIRPNNVHEWGKCGCGEDVVWQIDGKFGHRCHVCFTCGYSSDLGA